MIKHVLALLLASAVVASGTSTAAPAADCGGGASNFLGEVITSSFAPGAVRVQWTVSEDGTIREYRLSRYPSGCARPSCAVRVATVRPTGSPAAFKTSTLMDTVPPGAWIYRLEIRRAHGPSCMFESAEVLVSAPPPCDTAALCAQVEASFAGTVIFSSAVPTAVALRWATHAEIGAGSYRLSRFDCAVSRDCTTEVATIDAIGTCGQVMVHSVTDAMPAGTWTYALEVLDSGGRTACTMRLPGPAAPASSR